MAGCNDRCTVQPMKDKKKCIDLDSISDDDLLEVKINELPLKIEGTWLADCMVQLYKE